MNMADTKSIMITFMLIVIGLAVTGTIASSTLAGRWGTRTQTFTHAPGDGVTKVCTLYAGILRATVADTNATSPDYLTITANITLRPNWSVTSIGTDTTGPVITMSGLSNAIPTLITITYQFSVTSAALAMLNLIPLVWIVIVLAVGVAAIYIQFRNMRG
jgi:hypothetical protein